MATKLPLYIDLVKATLLTVPEVLAIGVTADQIYKRFPSQIKASDVKYPVITLSYDRNGRSVWAAIDDLNFYITIQVKSRDDIDPVVDGITEKLHLFKTVEGCLTVYKSFYKGGPPVPLFNDKDNTWETTLEFEVSIG